jgi:arginine decarboxylase
MSTSSENTFAQRDPLSLAGDAPLFASWLRFTAGVQTGEVTPFSIPGHKQRTHLVGPIVAGDVPLYAGLDTVQLSAGLLQQAEAAAAGLWGADWCRFSVGGSTHANQAIALALGAPGRTVIVSRTLHRSMLTGLILAGLRPVWVYPDVDPEHGLPVGVPVTDVAKALAVHPDACAVLLGDPSYVGTVADVAGYAEVAHAAGVPLVIDGAWAAHFGFHPDLPPHALSLGADALVISAHKTLPSMGQAALLLARTDSGRLNSSRLERGFEVGHTTSPSGAILASIDASRALLAGRGEHLLGALIQQVSIARERLSAVPGVRVLASSKLDSLLVDPAKLVVQLAGTGAFGGQLEIELAAAGVPVEMADRDTVVPMVTISDDETTVGRLVDQLIAAIERNRGPARPPATAASWTTVPQPVLPPREAFFAEHETVPVTAAIGRVSAELVAPYPPGIPLLAPGELITAEIVAALQATRRDGGRIAYADDPTLTTFQVLRQP